MYEQFIRDRITSLRISKQVSERQMSLDMGHSTSYIHNITCGKSLPSMTEFLYICEYFGITPNKFFAEENKNPPLIRQILSDLNALEEQQIQNIAQIIKGLKK